MAKIIKSETSLKYDYTIESFQAEEVELKAYKSSYREYDKNGNLIIDINYESSGDINEKYILNYDGNGFLIEKEIFFDENEIAEKLIYERDEKGKLLKVLKHYSEGSIDTIFYKYDKDNLIEKSTVDSDGDEDEKEIFKYKNGKIVSEEKLDSDNELVEKNTYKFDEKGNLTEKNSLNSEDDKKVKLEYFYTKNGEQEKILYYNDSNQLIAKSMYKYNEAGKIIQLIEEGQNHKSILKLEYDKNGNVKKQEEYGDENQLNNSIERKFDNENNLLESKVSINKHGLGINDDYVIKIEYEFFDD